MRELYTICGHASGYRATCSAYSRAEADTQRARMVSDHASRGIYFALVEVHRTTINDTLAASADAIRRTEALS